MPAESATAAPTRAGTAGRASYAGLFLITLATLMYEILLTRIFSVTMWYHFAFLAISTAMFGMTVGALAVYLLPGVFTPERARYSLAVSSIAFSLTAVATFLFIIQINFGLYEDLGKVLLLSANYALISIPFIMSGISVCVALTKFPSQVSQLYAADLAGGAAGCFLLIATLRWTDGVSAVFVVAFTACLASVCFARDADARALQGIALAACAALGSVSVVHTLRVREAEPWFRLVWVKGRREGRPLFEGWNSFSRVWVDGDPDKPEEPFGWGLSPTYPAGRKVRELHMNIDASAATTLTGFDGNLEELDYLKYDITNLAHYLRRDARVLVVGTGGGRDILSAMVFGQRAIVGVELNPLILAAANKTFGGFTGHLDRYPQVRFVNDEARSYITRSPEKFDIIQASLIDTWAATAAGAFALSENSLYTVEAWKLFLSRLEPNGVLSFSRWYAGSRPDQAYRLTALAVAGLHASGVHDVRHHLLMARRMPDDPTSPAGIATLLVSPDRFSDADVARFEDVCRQMRFELVLTPTQARDSVFATVASDKNLTSFFASFPANIAPPSDDDPFFFLTAPLRSAWQGLSRPSSATGMDVTFLLAVVLATVLILTFLCIFLPLLITMKRHSLGGSLPLGVFFTGIGLGFMLVEISQMQRLIVFLGHPVYGLSVVLFALLLSSGLGSFLTEKVPGSPGAAGRNRLLLLLAALAIFGLLTPSATVALRGLTTPARILVALAILFPLGLFMGMAFPLGMKAATKRSGALTPWFWGINGATSVTASVVGIAIALSWGITAEFWAGFACYAVAFLAFLAAGERAVPFHASPEQ